MSKNILLIVEGDRRERDFFNRLEEVFDLGYEIYSLKTNIYSLYKKMKDYEFNADIVEVLKETNLSVEERKLLNNKFAYVYLVFDFDIQHNSRHGVFSEKQLQINLDKIKEMTKYFVNETDPTIGKLYLNFPMFESYRDLDSFTDEGYKDRICKLDEIKKYKFNTSNRSLANIRIDKYSQQEFISLAKINLLKLNYMLNNKFETLSFEEYQKITQFCIVLKQGECILNNFINVLNTSCLFIIDYFGNNNNFYKRLFSV